MLCYNIQYLFRGGVIVKQFRRIVAIMTAVVMVSVPVYADVVENPTINMDHGYVTLGETNYNQQGNNQEYKGTATITATSDNTTSTLTIDTSGGDQVNAVIHDVNFRAPVEVKGNGTANISMENVNISVNDP